MTENVCSLLDNLTKHNSRAYGYELNQSEIVQILKLFDSAKELEQYRAIGTVEGYELAINESIYKHNLMVVYKDKLKEYETIGTIEEFKRAKEIEAVYEQIKWERDVAISQLEEIGVGLGQKMEEFKTLKEKNEPKEMDRYYCPICRHYFEDTDAYNYCPICGQKMKPIWQ